MGKATRWLRALFGPKKTSSGLGSRRQPPENHGSSTVVLSYPKSSDDNKHAIAVAAATAAVAEAALAAAHAAAEVVRLTTGTGGGGRTYYAGERRREAAAVKIQSAFRAYLARRALRALKGLVKLQALVRGHIVRKQSADMLRRMQAMARLQARACANRAYSSASPHSSIRSSRSHHHPRSSSMSNVNGSFGLEQLHRSGPNWLENWMEETSWTSKHDDESDKILEVDTWKPCFNPSPRNCTTPAKPHKPSTTRFASEVLPLSSIWETEKAARIAENTPRAYSASSRPGSSHKRSPFTPAGRVEYSQSIFGDYPSYPNYMANTESSQAKLRSFSAPRQRMQFERFSTTRRSWDNFDIKSERGFRR